MKTIVAYLIFRRAPEWFEIPVCNEDEKWNLITFSYRCQLKTRDIQLVFSKTLFRNLKTNNLNQFAQNHFEHFSPFPKYP